MGDSREPRSPLIERATPRAVFAQLVAQALGETGVEPSPMATAYLIELLEARVPAAQEAGAPTLAEEWFAARCENGRARVGRLRGLGDRALFVSGFFGASLTRSVVGRGYYRDMGRSAYGAVASALSSHLPERGGPRLFEELADRFGELVEVLADVSDRTHGSRPERLLSLYEQYLVTGSARDRRRLVRAGCVPPAAGKRRRWQ